MGRTVLLLVTTALALVAAGGIALAATFTCSANPCDGTPEADRITGTVGAETINGQAGNDEISGLDANDTLNGGAGDDNLAGGPGNDGYLVTTNWGSDTIIDNGGNNDSLGPAPDNTMPPLTVNLVSGTGPEYADGNGNAVNWNDGAIGSVSTGAADDVISQRPKDSNGLDGGAGDDTYTGYTSDPFGGDTINDPSGTADVLDLSVRSLALASWTTPFRSLSGGNARVLRIDFHDGVFLCQESGCDFLEVKNYFDSTSPDVCQSGPGVGVVETIRFAGGQSVGFSQAKSLAAGQDGTDNDRDGNTDEFDETCPAPIEDTTAPTVAGTSPANNATGVAPAANVSATFSEGMDQSTLTPATFTLTKQGSTSPLATSVSYDGANKKATLDPASDLEASTAYVATVKGGPGGAKDPAGNALVQDHISTFTTAASPAPPCTITGTANAETISGTDGTDVICARGGNDTIRGLGGNDILKGEAGNDTASYSASLTAVTASLATNSATGEGSDTFSGVEKLLGSSKADTLTGSDANNALTGGGGNDTVVGGGGADTLKGSGGADAVDSRDGVSGNDALDGGAGTDTKVTDATEKSIVGFP